MISEIEEARLRELWNDKPKILEREIRNANAISESDRLMDVDYEMAVTIATNLLVRAAPSDAIMRIMFICDYIAEDSLPAAADLLKRAIRDIGVAGGIILREEGEGD